MAKLQAKKIAAALQKAQRVGEVEEAFTIAGCSVALRSMRQMEYEAAMAAVGEDEDNFVQLFKLENISRSMVEINGEDLREYDFVEVDVEEMNNQTGRSEVKHVTLERHQFIKDYVLSSWSREAVDVAFRKWNDLVAKAERKAAEGVVFELPDESAEEKYRRLLSEAKAIEPNVPHELGVKIRDEVGYALRQEYLDASEKLSQVKLEGGPGIQIIQEEDLPKEPPPDIATRPVGPALQPPSAMAGIFRQPPTSPASSRAAEIAALEESAPVPAETPPLSRAPGDIPVLESRQPQFRDPAAAASIIDQPPAGGINPRFRPPPRL